MSHRIVFKSPQQVGEWPNIQSISELRIHSFSFTDFQPNQDVAEVTIVVQDPQEKFQHPVVTEKAVNREFMQSVLAAQLPDGKTVAQHLLERFCLECTFDEKTEIKPLPPES